MLKELLLEHHIKFVYYTENYLNCEFDEKNNIFLMKFSKNRKLCEIMLEKDDQIYQLTDKATKKFQKLSKHISKDQKCF